MPRCASKRTCMDGARGARGESDVPRIVRMQPCIRPLRKPCNETTWTEGGLSPMPYTDPAPSKVARGQQSDRPRQGFCAVDVPLHVANKREGVSGGKCSRHGFSFRCEEMHRAGGKPRNRLVMTRPLRETHYAAPIRGSSRCGEGETLEVRCWFNNRLASNNLSS
jgi:hypothetical protein